MTPEFKKRFINACMEKHAQSKGKAVWEASKWLPFLGFSILANTIGQTINQFIATMMQYFDAKREQSMSKEYYTKMLEAHPTLMKEDAKTVAKYWSSLYHFAPHMAKDPLAAGAYIRQSIDRGLEELGGPSPDIVKNLSDIENQTTAAKARKVVFAPSIDVTEANPMRGVAQGLIRSDVERNPELYGLPVRNP